MIVDLRSDTVTKPTKAMLAAMLSAEVGDDVFEEDPTLNALEAKAAAMFGHEAGLFCPSGTMTNQVAIRVHTHAGAEVICDRSSHVYNYEGGGIAVNSRASVRLLHGDRGRFTGDDVRANINNPNDVHLPLTKLVCVEDTCNRGGGCFYDLETLKGIQQATKEAGLPLHLDGARVFNALVETGYDYVEYGQLFDSISVCLSKGLGAPIGSVLLGSMEFIRSARRVRKVLGGGMRQVGILAAAADYALDHHITRLKEDHERGRALGAELAKQAYVKEVIPVETNIVVFVLNDDVPQADFLANCQQNGIRCVGFGPQRVRMVTHLDIGDAHMEALTGRLSQLWN